MLYCSRRGTRPNRACGKGCTTKLHNRPGARLMAESCTGDVAWVRALSAPWLRLWVYTIKTEKKKDPTYNKALWAATRLWAAHRMSTAHWPATRLWAARRVSIFSSGPTRPTPASAFTLPPPHHSCRSSEAPVWIVRFGMRPQRFLFSEKYLTSGY